ncbi:MAG: hypothetical protein Q4F80_09265, partial [bacterium]|nr:hypothetical protein [bacterium]
NGKEIEPYLMKTKNSYFSYEQNNSPVYSITFKVKDGEFLKNEFKNVVISIGSNIFYFNGEDILNFEKNTEGEYILPKDVKYDKNSKFITDKGGLKNMFSFTFL